MFLCIIKEKAAEYSTALYIHFVVNGFIQNERIVTPICICSFTTLDAKFIGPAGTKPWFRVFDITKS